MQTRNYFNGPIRASYNFVFPRIIKFSKLTNNICSTGVVESLPKISNYSIFIYCRVEHINMFRAN